MQTSESARRLAEMINRAIEDHRITNAEYEEIQRIANEDNIIDAEERALLAQLQEMISEKSVKRVAE
jgi:hypothetical protein